MVDRDVNETTIESRDTLNIPASGKVLHSDSGSPICSHMTHGSGRNLALCIDGSSNQFGEKNTNVIEFYNLILKRDEDRQQTWYNSGIGTYARPSWKSIKYYRQVVYSKVDLAIAWDFERTVQGAYRWLSDNYQTGDCIFLFGFSRGAFQVRVLSAMIDKVGLIHKGNEMQIPFAYELYADSESDNQKVTQVGSTDKMSSVERFKKAFSREDVKVHFVGAWDTVSSIGIARGTNMLPGTVDGMKHVCLFRHALALDERRVKFLPEYAYGGSTKPPPPKPSNQPWSWNFWHSDRYTNLGSEEAVNNENLNTPSQSTTTNLESKQPHTLEVWFAGTHSDIGGGNVKNEGMDRSQPPLRWMVLQAGMAGLRTKPFGRGSLEKPEKLEIRESLSWHWWFLELLPLKRLTYSRHKKGISETRKPHLGSPRIIHEGQKIHISFLRASALKNGQPYTPRALPLDDIPNFWESARRNQLNKWMEQDIYEDIDNNMKKFDIDMDSNTLQNLRKLALLGADGREAVCEELYKSIIAALKANSGPRFDRKWKLLASTLDILCESPKELMQKYSLELRTLIRGLGLPTRTDDCQTAKQFMEKCTTPCIHVLRAHTNVVTSVAFSSDGKHIASGSADTMIRIWDLETGAQVGEALKGHTDWVQSVAFSPDGKRIVSGSDDHTIRLWDSTTRKLIGAPFQGHTKWVMSVTFSPDGTRVVSGSSDETVRIWDCETGEQIGKPLAGHRDCVRSVTFSPDGTRIVSGSDDCTIRLWDLQTGAQIGQPFAGHTHHVTSAAISPDGKRIVSGSVDKTIRLWDIETGKQFGEPFRGHTNVVWSVAFSPDGRRVVSGSWDETVRIWDVGTGKQVGESLRGHTEYVNSVAFSPDGKCVVSGSDDSTVRIWDVEMYMDTE